MRHLVMAITSTRLMTKGWLIFACLLIGARGVADPIHSDRIHVIDGDTIHVAGTTADVRLVGFNAPETRGHDVRKSMRSGQRQTAAFARSFAVAISISHSSRVLAVRTRKARRCATTDAGAGPCGREGATWAIS